jgi:hypothetical protein
VKRAVLAAILVLGVSRVAIAASPSCDSMVGTWHNQLGSTLQIDSVDAASGQVAGKYQSPSGAGSTMFPLVGWINSATGSGKDRAPIISFSVRWAQFGSVTAWVGTCQSTAGKPTIATLWHLVRGGSDFSWDHILSGADTFTPGAPAAAAKK